MRNLIIFILLFASIGATAQNQDANPFGGVYYNDHSNYRMFGADVLTRSTRATAEARTNVIKGDHLYDTLTAEILLYNGSAWVGISGGNTLDESYDQGGDGVGREITANDGAVKIAGEDGLLVTGTFGSGAATEISGTGTRMFFNPKKAAFRAGYVDGTQWDDANIGDASVALNSLTTASGESSTATGNETIASGESSLSIGNNTAAKSFAETALGTYNTDYTPTSTTAWSATDRIFGVGNGASSGALSDALIILKNGKTTMPSTTGSFTPNVLTTTERNALTATAGMMIYNSTTSKHQGYDGSAWNDFY